MKHAGAVVEILEAFDLTGSLRDAARLAGCSPMTVARYVCLRETGRLPTGRSARRDQLIDPHLAKVEEWVERSHGRVRADIVHDKLRALGFGGSERTTRRAVARPRRRTRPAIDGSSGRGSRSPGCGSSSTGARVRDRAAGDAPVVRLAGLVEVPGRHPDLGSNHADGHRLPRRDAAAVRRQPDLRPDRQRADGHRPTLAGIAVKHPVLVAAGRHYGLQVHVLRAGRPSLEGGSEARSSIAKADLVPDRGEPLSTNTPRSPNSARPATPSVIRSTLVEHRETRQPPVDLLADERRRLHPVPDEPYTVAFGVDPGRRRGVHGPLRLGPLLGAAPARRRAVWVRIDGDELVVAHVGPNGASEAARHRLTTPGNPRIDPAHYPSRTSDPLHPKPKPASPEEAAFLELGPGPSAGSSSPRRRGPSGSGRRSAGPPSSPRSSERIRSSTVPWDWRP